MEPNLEQQFPFPDHPAFIVAAFIAVLVVERVIRRKLRAKRLKREGQIVGPGAAAPTIEQRVANNPDWATGQIRSGGKVAMYILAGSAIFWNLVTTVPFFQSLATPTATSTQRIVLGFLALIGVALIAFAARLIIRRYRYGESLCCIDGKAGVLGETLSGKIKTVTPVDALGEFTVKLRCTDTYSSGTGKNRSTHVDVKFEREEKIPHAGKNSQHGIPFSFALPANGEETGDQLARGRLHWELSIHAPTKGVDYSASFIVPVFKMT